jgi:diguanylate cyclase (GGDEF)-like protein
MCIASLTSSPPGTFRRVSLVKKLIVSYAVMLLFTLAALVYAVYGLYSLNRTAREIAQSDLTALSSLTRLRTSLLAQEGYAGRYAILKGTEFIDLFREREKEFTGILRMLGEGGDQDTVAIEGYYLNYRQAVTALFADGKGNPARLRDSAQRLLAAIDALYDSRQKQLQSKLHEADAQQNDTITWTITLSLSGFFVVLAMAAIFVFHTATALGKLKRATHRIAEGDFDYDPKIPPGDEIGDLARDFTTMAAKLKVLEQMSLDASPLTRLPGNIAIERVLERRLQEGVQFAVCYADLDNFKAYNDRYGYVQASELIKITGEIIHEAVRVHGDRDTFVGHVGGDDFVMILSADHASTVCEAVIDLFTAEVIKHYSAEDIAKGGIEGTDRYGVDRFFPLMTISIAVIICGRGEFTSAVEIARSAAEIKEYVKEKPGSCYFISRRKQTR